MKKVFIETYGCQMNIADSERMAGVLLSAGYNVVKDDSDADIVILNTCAVRKSAEQKVWSRLGRLRKVKSKKLKVKSERSKNEELIVGVAGCMAQQYGKKFFDKAQNVNFVIGTYRFHKVGQLLDETRNGKKVIDVECIENDGNGVYPVRDNAICAWVTISRGCNNKCSYCVVPNVRGPERNRPLDKIVAEVEHLSGKGYKEVTLLGQNVNSYHDKSESNFVDLLKRVSEIKGIERIRFVTSHPKDASLGLFKAVKDMEKVCECLHLPVQSGSNRILEKMNRRYTREHYLGLIKNVREIVPDVSVSSDVIVGFPGETEDDFKDTYNLVKEAEFDSAFIFKYSTRPNTIAGELKDDVPADTKKQRHNCLLKLQEEIGLKKNKLLVGQTVQILVEGESKNNKNRLMGRTRTNKIVMFPLEDNLIGRLVNVEITEAGPHTLYGTKK